MKNVNSSSNSAVLSNWLFHHRESAGKSFTRIFNNPLSFTFTAFLIAIAFAIPMAMYLVISSLGQLTGQWDGDKQITLFLHKEVTFIQATKLTEQIAQTQGILIANAINNTEVLNDFKQEANFDLSLEALKENPLPHIIVVTPAADTDPQTIANRLRTLPQVDTVQFDYLWFQRLQALSELVLRIQWIVGILLFLTVALIIVNVIRWEVTSRFAEIEIIKLIGATDAYVRRPFLYFGCLLGLVGAALAVAVVSLSCWLINQSLINLSTLFESGFQIPQLPLPLIIGNLIFSSLIGIGASWFAAHQKIKTVI